MLVTLWVFLVVHMYLPNDIFGSGNPEISIAPARDAVLATWTDAEARSGPEPRRRVVPAKRSIARSEPVSLLRKVQGSTRIALDIEPQSETYLNAKILYSYTPDANQPDDSFNNTAPLVLNVLHKTANHSWEWGTEAQVLLEMKYPDLSVYSTRRKLPLTADEGPIEPPQLMLDLIDPILARRDPSKLSLVDGDGAAGDPASLGVAVLVATVATSNDTVRSERYRKLAEGQLQWVLNQVPRSPEGAISMRENEVQFWADFIYMLPPFLAYYGAATSNITLLQCAYDQVRLYRQKLQTSSETKLWSHIIEGKKEDRLIWSTGNGWAAAGMMRVYATFANLRDVELYAQTESWRKDLAEWVLEIANAAFNHQQMDTKLIPNYMLTDDPKRDYPECSGTALIASAAYRLASLEPSTVPRLPLSTIAKSRIAIFSKYTNSTTGAVGPVVDPFDWNAEKAFTGATPEAGDVSPEGQAFVLLLYAAWNAYTNSSQSSANYT
ncbi:hypothetical protein PTTG_06229 [Puccinia triticina 1-1 BBBD Race 1]|uniref:Alpha-L-rhamnosidase six-hairpin glycosidase domain-containing protein n=1 Tax=Puccinia triticina (isolate 1-1 / race 1 (BBBD)) TaxID=630390 RepID=A0A180GR99_PUCT1|nr:hypothetical protein PTTG_06229 [Puccinia triticina 1-1 BBBD Race 1]